ncbi:unnamed protein product [Rhizophagus irregularis]|nr:unnamed protein product [Rhizophagus irregularis]
MGKNDFAIWKDGPLSFFWKWTRKSDERIALIYLDNSQDIVEFLEEVQKYLLKTNLYGISQNPCTKDYVVVIKYSKKCCIESNENNSQYIWCKSCQMKYLTENFINWTSGNEKIDYFIQEMQLKINRPTDIVFEWIPFDQFSDIKEISKNNFAAVYLALWKDGPLYWNIVKYTRNANTTVALKRLYNSKNINNKILNAKIKSYQNYNKHIEVYGVCQNPDTKDYIIILNNKYYWERCLKCNEIYTNTEYKLCKSCGVKENFTNWISSENKIIDDFVQQIQKMQLGISYPTDVIFKWTSSCPLLRTGSSSITI